MLRWVILLFIILPSVSVAQNYCDYNNTNSLVWDKAFDQAIRNFFGDRKANFYWPNGKIASQALTGLGGPPDDLKMLKHGSAIASACRAHSCMEKAAVVISCPTTISAVAIFHFHCTKKNCDEKPTATIFYKNKKQSTYDVLKAWAREKASSENTTVSIDAEPLN